MAYVMAAPEAQDEPATVTVTAVASAAELRRISSLIEACTFH